MRPPALPSANQDPDDDDAPLRPLKKRTKPFGTGSRKRSAQKKQWWKERLQRQDAQKQNTPPHAGLPAFVQPHQQPVPEATQEQPLVTEAPQEQPVIEQPQEQHPVPEAPQEQPPVTEQPQEQPLVTEQPPVPEVPQEQPPVPEAPQEQPLVTEPQVHNSVHIRSSGTRKKQLKPHRYRPGTVALREIRQQQKISHKQHAIPKSVITRCFKEHLGTHRNPTVQRVTATAVEAIHEALEAYAVQLFEDTNLCAIHCGRVTIMRRDMQLVRRLRKETN